MKYLKRVCGVLLVLSVVALVATIRFNSRPTTIMDALEEELGDTAEEVYGSINNEISHYIVQYGFMTDSWYIEAKPSVTKEAVSVEAVLDDDTVLIATYNLETGECDVEVKN